MSAFQHDSRPSRLDRCDWLPPLGVHYPTRKSALFVTLQDFIGIAGQVYMRACRLMEPERGQSWLEESELTVGEFASYSHARDFHEHLCCELSEALYRHANVTGHFVPGNHTAFLRELSAEFDAVPAASGYRGGAPMDEGHGCPASASAVGPAPLGSHGADITVPANPLFCGSPMQGLPGVDGPRNALDIISPDGGEG